MTSAQREFLVQRLMEDSQKMRNAVIGNGSNLQKQPVHSSDSDEQMSDSSSDPGCTNVVVDSEKAAAPSREMDHESQINSNLMFANPLQYAATLASLAQMNFMQPSAASTLPLLYPHLYQSLLTMPNLERLRYHLQSPTEVLSKLASQQKTPLSTEKKLASISLTSPKPNSHQQSTPSPRKRSSTTAKNVDPNKYLGHNSDDNRSPKKARAIRKIQFDDEKSSPVSGMYIKDADEVSSSIDVSQPQNSSDEQLLHESADFVKITDEAKLELSKIPNVIGDFVCQLCKLKYDDAFRLAMHKCPRIGHKVYKCPECEKPFNCPANLASHRRWHRPKEEKASAIKRPATPSSSSESAPITPDDPEGPVDLTSKTNSYNDEYEFIVTSANGVATYFQCEFCKKKFDSHRQLRSHAIVHTDFAHDRCADDPEHQCPEAECDLWFLTLESCEKHCRQCHPKFLCKFCTESFPTSPALTRHINKHHPSNDCRVIILDETPTSF